MTEVDQSFALEGRGATPAEVSSALESAPRQRAEGFSFNLIPSGTGSPYFKTFASFVGVQVPRDLTSDLLPSALVAERLLPCNYSLNVYFCPGTK